MKTYKSLTSNEALARMQNWLLTNLKFTSEKLDNIKLEIQQLKGTRALLDIAFYIQWAYIEQIEEYQIINSVRADLTQFANPEFSLTTAGYECIYQHQTELLNCNEKVHDVATIAAILGDNFGKQLYEANRNGAGYMDAMDNIAKVAQEIYAQQSFKPDDLDWMDYLETLSVSCWDEWVITTGARLLQLKPELINA